MPPPARSGVSQGSRWRGALAAACALTFAAVAPRTLAADPVRLVLLTPASQSAPTEGLLPVPFSARVERANGEPVAGAKVLFEINHCILPGVPLPGVTCPDDAEYGGFETGATPRPLSFVAVSGPDGVATAAAYRVGTPDSEHVPLTFEVYPYVTAQTTAEGFVISLFDAVHPIGGYLVAATTVTVGGVASAIPTLGETGALLLSLLLGGAAVALLRRAGRVRAG